MKNVLFVLLALTLVTGCAVCGTEGDFAVEGESPAVSRDGRYLAFQRVEGTRMHLGVLDLATGEVDWVVRGGTAATRKENACHPAWGPDGSLVFAYANITSTAHQRFEKNGPKEGYALRIRKDGQVRELVGGLARNFTPSFSPDGKTVYFCRQDGRDPDRDERICAMDLETPGAFRTVRRKPVGDSGVCQPVVSPDGRLLAWAELADFGVAWRLKVAKLGDTSDACEILTGDFAAYAPAFFPDSRHLAFTGFRAGDPCWGVYVIDLATGCWKRLTDGEEPCVTADGKTLYFAKGGRIRRIALDARTFEGLTPQARHDVGAERERVLFRTAALKPGADMTVPADGAGEQATRFMRFTFDMDENNGRRSVAGISWGGKALIHFFTLERVMCFVSREQTDNGRKIDDGCVLRKGSHRVTGVRGADGAIYVSVDDGPAASFRCGLGLMPVRGDGVLSASGSPELNVREVEIGTGWPRNVPRPLTHAALMRR